MVKITLTEKGKTMAKGICYWEEFKQEATNYVVHHNYPVAEVIEW